MTLDVLMISTAAGMDACGELLERMTGATVKVANSRVDGMSALREGEFAVVVVEQNLVDGDPEWADQLWRHTKLAIPVQMNFAISGCERVLREVKSALARRETERALARRAVRAELENELKSSVTGLLLEGELALRVPQIPAGLEVKVRTMLQLAGTLRERLAN